MKTRNKLLSLLFVLCLTISITPIVAFAADTVTAATAYAGGSGTKDDPYQISNAAQMLYFNEQCATQGDFDNCGNALLIENYHGAYFVLTDDIDCSAITEWTPCSFAGNFDGQGHTISNLNIGYTIGDNVYSDQMFGPSKFVYVGFFETFYDGALSNLTFKDCSAVIPVDSTISSNRAGGMGIAAAKVYYAQLNNVSIEGCTVKNDSQKGNATSTYTGGIVGYSEGAYLGKCMVIDTDVSTYTGYAGGFTGTLCSLIYDYKSLQESGIILRFGGDANKYGIENSGIDADSTVVNTNGWSTGGMVGLWKPRDSAETYTGSVNALLKNNYCHAAIDVKINESRGVGGLIGEISYTAYPIFVENCYFAGSITDTATNRAGKGYIIGYATRNNAQSLTLNNCYGLNTLSLNALGEDRKYNGSYGGNTVKEMLGCATFGSNGVLTAETASDTLAADNLLDALNAWVTENSTETNSYLVWGKSATYPVFSADYTKVDEAIAKIPADLTVYTDTTVNELNNAVNAVVRDKNITEQTTVDGYATAIESAINALEYKGADYGKVDEAIAKANALNKEEYKDFSAVETAVNAVVRGKNITEQTTVDGYATAIESAINALEYKDADYGKVDEAIAKANALKKDEYKDFSAVENAVNAVVRDKNITEQAEVDAMAKAINDAISALEKKPSTEPGSTTKPTEPDTDTTSPATGDNSNMELWIALLFASCSGLVAVTVYGRKKKVNI